MSVDNVMSFAEVTVPVPVPAGVKVKMSAAAGVADNAKNPATRTMPGRIRLTRLLRDGNHVARTT
jgi:hypothetical protein